MQSTQGVDAHLITGYSIIHDKLEIRQSSIEGKGIFIGAAVPAGTILFDIVAEKIRYHNSQEMADLNPNWIGSGFEEWMKVGPGDIASLLNHSCLPTVIINENQQVVAMADLPAGQELLMDYSTTELDPFWKMDCSCEVPTCRKVLRSFQFLPKDLQERYGPYLAPSFTHTALALAEKETNP